MYMLNAHCKSLWIKASAKCINVNVILWNLNVRDVTRSRGTRSREIRLVSQERDNILAKYFAMLH